MSEGIHPNDIEVIETLSKETFLEIVKVPICKERGITDLKNLQMLIDKRSPMELSFHK